MDQRLPTRQELDEDILDMAPELPLWDRFHDKLKKYVVWHDMCDNMTTLIAEKVGLYNRAQDSIDVRGAQIRRLQDRSSDQNAAIFLLLPRLRSVESRRATALESQLEIERDLRAGRKQLRKYRRSVFWMASEYTNCWEDLVHDDNLARRFLVGLSVNVDYRKQLRRQKRLVKSMRKRCSILKKRSKTSQVEKRNHESSSHASHPGFDQSGAPPEDTRALKRRYRDLRRRLTARQKNIVEEEKDFLERSAVPFLMSQKLLDKEWSALEALGLSGTSQPQHDDEDRSNAELERRESESASRDGTHPLRRDHSRSTDRLSGIQSSFVRAKSDFRQCHENFNQLRDGESYEERLTGYLALFPRRTKTDFDQSHYQQVGRATRDLDQAETRFVAARQAAMAAGLSPVTSPVRGLHDIGDIGDNQRDGRTCSGRSDYAQLQTIGTDNGRILRWMKDAELEQVDRAASPRTSDVEGGSVLLEESISQVPETRVRSARIAAYRRRYGN